MARVFKRKGAWWIDFNDAAGVRHRKKIGSSKRIAGEVLDVTLGRVARREYLGIVSESEITFAEFSKVWKERISPALAPNTRKRWEWILKTILNPAFRGTLRSITPAMIESFISDRLSKGASVGTVRTEFGVLRHVLGRAVEWEYVGRNPASRVRSPKESPGRTRFLSDEEVTRLMAACEPGTRVSRLGRSYLRPFVIVALNTGMRRSEILSLQWQDVDLDRGLARLARTKNGDSRTVLLNRPAIEALRSIPRGVGPIFPFTPQAVTDAFERACDRAGILDFRLHDLRHTFASYHAMGGVPQKGLQALLGHRDARMTARYTHLSESYLREAVERVSIGSGVKNASENGTHLAPEDSATA